MENIDRLVEMVTAEILKRIKCEEKTKSVLIVGENPDCDLAGCLQEKFTTTVKPDLNDVRDYDYVVLPVKCLNELMSGASGVSGDSGGSGGECKTVAVTCEPACEPCGETLDFTCKKLIHEKALYEIYTAKVDAVRIAKKAIVTQLAADFIKKHNIAIIRVD